VSVRLIDNQPATARGGDFRNDNNTETTTTRVERSTGTRRHATASRTAPATPVTAGADMEYLDIPAFLRRQSD
jgi:hypothetical protein